MPRPKLPDPNSNKTNPSLLHSRYSISSNKNIPILVARKSLLPLTIPSSLPEASGGNVGCNLNVPRYPSKLHESPVSFYKCLLIRTGICIRHHHGIGLLILLGILFIFITAYQLVTLPFQPARGLSIKHVLESQQSLNMTSTIHLEPFHEIPKRRIVLLAGPHKTGTTSIQSNLYSWTRNAQNILQTNDTSAETTTSKSLLLPSWYWPVPTMVNQIESNDPRRHDAWTPAKGFYALVEAMRNHTYYLVEDRLLFKNYTYDQVVDMYKDELQYAWDKGYNIVLGTEAVDYCIKDFDGQRLLEQLIDLLPQQQPLYSNPSLPSSIESTTTTERQAVHTTTSTTSTTDHISVVVTYRSPRVKHLISIWHQTKMKVENFRTWMTNTKNEFGALDSLALVEMLLENRLHVILIDSSGLLQSGYDISSIVACDVLGAECTPNKTLRGLQSEPMKKNVKENKNFNLNAKEEELHAMDLIMKQYDCQFQHLIHHANLTILYGYDLTHNMELCNNNVTNTGTREGMSRLEMKKQLVEIIRLGDDTDTTVQE